MNSCKKAYSTLMRRRICGRRARHTVCDDAVGILNYN